MILLLLLKFLIVFALDKCLLWAISVCVAVANFSGVGFWHSDFVIASFRGVALK
jgi:hypothetical protein